MLGVVSRTAYEFGLTPFALVAWRAGIGTLVIGIFVLLAVQRGGRLVGWRSLDGRGRMSLGLAGLMGATLNMAMFLAFARLPVAIVLLCFYIYPAIVTGASALLGWERMDRPRAVALIVALAGMIAVVAGGPGQALSGGLDLLGIALALSAALSQAVFVLVSRRGYREVPTDQAMTVILATSMLVAGFIAVAGEGIGSIVLPFSIPGLLALLLFAGIFSAAIPSFLFLAGIRWIGPVKAGILMLIEPLVGVGLAALFLQESIGAVQAAGGFAILAAAVIIQRARPSETVILPAAEPEGDQGLTGDAEYEADSALAPESEFAVAAVAPGDAE